ncbi:MAG: LuxR C-terminal-related transcriptional regulator [Solirubrobacteraceae bacterium]
MAGASELKLVLGDDQVATRLGVRRAVEPYGLRVVGEAATAADAIGLCVRERPDVCVLATGIPGNAIEAVRKIRQQAPGTKVVMLGLPERGEELFGALRAGADGYLLASMSPERLHHAITGVVNGEAALPRVLTAELIREFRERGNTRRVEVSEGEIVELSAREFEVLDRLRRNERTAEVAVRLGIAEATVRRHVASIMRKLGVSSRRGMIELFEHGGRRAG